MTIDLLPANMPPDQQINTLYVWVATHANGGEGIVACFLPGLGTSPMVASKRTTMERAEPLVRRAVALTRGRGPEEVVAIRLVEFRRVPDA